MFCKKLEANIYDQLRKSCLLLQYANLEARHRQNQKLLRLCYVLVAAIVRQKFHFRRAAVIARSTKFNQQKEENLNVGFGPGTFCYDSASHSCFTAYEFIPASAKQFNDKRPRAKGILTQTQVILKLF